MSSKQTAAGLTQRFLRWITGLAAQRPRLTLVVALVCLAAGLAVTIPGLARLQPFTSATPASQSGVAQERLAQASGVDPYLDIVALVSLSDRINQPASTRRIDRVASVLRANPRLGAVRVPSNDRSLISSDRRSALVIAPVRKLSFGQQLDAARQARDELAAMNYVTVGGAAAFYANGNDTAREDLIRAELLAFPLLLLVMLWVFRGLVAALLPLAIGMTTVSFAVVGLRVLDEVTPVSIFALNLVTALGLGLAVDYSLLIVSRFREEFDLNGGDTRRALGATFETAGRTVLLSALTVAGATASLVVFPQAFLRSTGIGASLVALGAALGSLLLLPAFLAIFGSKINAFPIGKRRRAAIDRDDQGWWFTFSRRIMRHALPIALVSGAILLALGLPALGTNVTQVDYSVVPKESPDRQVYETTQAKFTEIRGSTAFVALEAGPGPDGSDQVRAFRRSAQAVPGVKAAGPPTYLGSETWQLGLRLHASGVSRAAEDTTRELRAVPTPLRHWTGGEAASLIDLKSSLGERLPWAVSILLLVTMLGIFLISGSIVIPIKTVLMNALTLCATFGILVLVFQNGAAESLLDYTSSGALEASTIILVFVVGYGLATDYGAFLISRIKEARDTGASNQLSVALGLERTGRIITAAALLLTIALGSLASGSHALVKEAGAGMALAVIIDATLVRVLLVPSLMQLMGRFNWWVPRALENLHKSVVREDVRLPKLSAATAGSRTASLDDCRRPSRYCDSSNPRIRTAALELVPSGVVDDRAAVALFEFVRDEVAYEFGPWGVRASQTLAARSGTCSTKANLLVALFRSLGVPAAYGMLRVDARRYFGNIALPFVAKHLSPYSIHVYAAVWTNSGWVKCDPSTDSVLAGKTGHFCQQTQLVRWDGRHDAVDILDPRHIQADLGLFADIDRILDRDARAMTSTVFAAGNDYLRFIRSHDVFDNSDELISAYRSELLPGTPGYEFLVKSGREFVQH
jgi:uncharacterized membrane protein YdfJ with MMPL/SSD domain